MKEHFCPVEQSTITYQGKCNWCGEREALAQRTWVGLTDEERKETLQSVNTGFVVDASVVAQAIEAKLKEKNT